MQLCLVLSQWNTTVASGTEDRRRGWLLGIDSSSGGH